MHREPDTTEPRWLPLHEASERLSSYLSNSTEFVLNHQGRGWADVPVPFGRKAAVMVGWPGFRATSDQLPRLFGHGENIAVILGPPSGELVDLDLDCAEALALADLYLPPTRAVFGRASKPSAHRLYVAPVAAYEAFADPLTGATC